MDNETYLEESSRSVAPNIHTDLSVAERNILRLALADMITAGTYCDAIKRKLFYGLSQEDIRLPQNTSNLIGLTGLALEEHLKQFVSQYDANDLIHGIIGAAGEAGELVDALTTAILTRQPIDRINVIEEVGDVLWYLALILRSQNSSISQAMELNIEKLKKRYPEQWSQEAVLNRDEKGERKILEKADIDTLSDVSSSK